MKIKLDENWMTKNNGYPLDDEEVKRYNAVLPSKAQLEHAKTPFYCFIHFGMNTATEREWGNATETVDDFTITKVKPEQWAKCVKSAGAEGIIFTCKHHDGFCLWNTGTTDFNSMNAPIGKDIVKEVADACKKEGLKFGIYLSPWDMHEETYGTRHYNDFFCRQLTELLSNYGEVFEVWLDGAKGADAKSFVYDWERYYKIVRTIQPMANIAICGPDIRWVGNEDGNARKSEYCVVPKVLTLSETLENKENLKHSGVAELNSKSEDLGSREVLSQNAELAWYPAEVDVSIREGWFYPGGDSVKSADKLFKLYLNSVGNNSFLLLNVPPTDKGVIHRKDKSVLKKLGLKLEDAFTEPVLSQSFGELNEGYVEFKFDSPKKLRYCVIEEDISKGQRIEKFDLYIEKTGGKYKKISSGTVIGMRKIIKLKGTCEGAVLVIRQSRQAPVIQKIAFYD